MILDLHLGKILPVPLSHVIKHLSKAALLGENSILILASQECTFRSYSGR